jgi:hypothetical protein
VTRSQLVRVLPPPVDVVDRPGPGDWVAIEVAFQCTLPANYKWFVDTYGSGRIGDVLWIFNPAARPSMLRLQTMDIEMRGILAELLARPGQAEQLDGKSADDFVCFGSDEEGDFFLWERASLGATDAPVVVVSRLATRASICGGFLEFLHAAIEGRVEALGVDLEGAQVFTSARRR